jgi:hypothetical protein
LDIIQGLFRGALKMRHDAALKLLMMSVRKLSTRHGMEEHQKPWGSLGFSTEG